MLKHCLCIAVLVAISNAKTLESSHHHDENPVDVFGKRAMRMLGETAKELLKLVMEEKERGTFTVDNIKRLTHSVSQETARMLPTIPSPNIPAKMALGVAGLAAGAAGVGYGAKTFGSSLYDVYDSFDWRASVMAMSKDDFLERTFDWLNVQDADCKRKIICEVEQYAANKSVFKKYILRFLSHRHPGLAQYKDAVDAGLDFYDCQQIYPTCQASMMDVLGNIPLDRVGINADYINAVPWNLISEKLMVLKNMI